jgi:hypothetical protein
MGVTQLNRKSKIYYNVMNGKVVRSYGKVKPEQEIEGLTARINKKQDTVYEVNHDAVSGRIKSIGLIESTDYGDKLELVLTDFEEESNVQMMFSGNYAKSFMMRMHNINPTQDITIVPYSFVDRETGKTRTGLTIYQGGLEAENKITPTWTKDNPGELPTLEKIKVKGKETWDDSKQLEFLTKELKKFQNAIASSDPISVFEAKTENVENKALETNDLPF